MDSLLRVAYCMLRSNLYSLIFDLQEMKLNHASYF